MAKTDEPAWVMRAAETLTKTMFQGVCGKAALDALSPAALAEGIALTATVIRREHDMAEMGEIVKQLGERVARRFRDQVGKPPDGPD